MTGSQTGGTERVRSLVQEKTLRKKRSNPNLNQQKDTLQIGEDTDVDDSQDEKETKKRAMIARAKQHRFNEKRNV
jgi:hypothetical protein